MNNTINDIYVIHKILADFICEIYGKELIIEDNSGAAKVLKVILLINIEGAKKGKYDQRKMIKLVKDRCGEEWKNDKLSKAIKAVNGILGEFCEGKGIAPPIHITYYKNNGKDRKQSNIGCHLECSYSDKHSPTDLSSVIEQLENAKETIREQADKTEKPSNINKWIELYKQCALDDEYLEGKWIRLKCVKNESELFVSESINDIPGKVSGWQPEDLFQVADANKYLTLTGPSGSGKTTALKMLCAYYLSKEHSQKNYLPLYLRLKELENIRNIENDIGKHGIARLVANRIASVLIDTYLKKAEDDCVRKELNSHMKLLKYTSSDQLFKEIHNQCYDWYCLVGRNAENVVLLLDGLNELMSPYRDNIELELDSLIGQGCKIIVSVKDNISNTSLATVKGKAVTYKISEPNDTDIQSHFEHYFSEEKATEYIQVINSDAKMRSMMLNLYFMDMTLEWFQTNPAPKVQLSKSVLVNNHIQQLIRKKRREGILSDVLDDCVFNVLQYVAKWQVSKFTKTENKKAACIFYNSPEFIELQKANYPVYEALLAAEQYGILSTSGLSHESKPTHGNPDFRHDLIRDYFVSLCLKRSPCLADSDIIGDVLEYLEWETALIMYYEQQDNQIILSDDIKYLANIDPFEACRCYYYSPVKTEYNPKPLLNMFLSRIAWQLDSHQAKEIQYNIKDALSQILGYYNREQLLSVNFRTF